MKLPKHEGGLNIYHNEHKGSYETVEQWIKNVDLNVDDFVSYDEMMECIKNNDMWNIHWYPDTPVGFYSIYGSSFESVLNKALEIDNEL